jgi:DEAD/DEAH box helicase domain-containing protein
MSTLPAITGDKDQSLDAALARMLSAHDSANRADDPDPHVTTVRRLPPVTAEFAAFPEAMDARLARALRARGIGQLYTHQAEAIRHALGGRNVVTVTPTASGKTLCYNAPVLDAILNDPSTRALYLFPTKALAQDQLAELHGLVELLGADTPSASTGGTPEPQNPGTPEPQNPSTPEP